MRNRIEILAYVDVDHPNLKLESWPSIKAVGGVRCLDLERLLGGASVAFGPRPYRRIANERRQALVSVRYRGRASSLLPTPLTGNTTRQQMLRR